MVIRVVVVVSREDEGDESTTTKQPTIQVGRREGGDKRRTHVIPCIQTSFGKLGDLGAE
jgi:hypothetical protein